VVSRPAIALAAAVVALCAWAGDPAALADHTCQGLVSTIHGTEGDDVLAGTNGDDVIHGLGGSDEIDGLAGNDIICGGGAWDYLVGGPGDDTLDGGGGGEAGEASYASAPGPITASLETGTATGDGTDTLINIGSLSGSNFGDTLTASDAGSHLFGAGGPDILNGGAGRDILVGGDGNDELYGGDDRDILEGSEGLGAGGTGGDDTLDGGPGADVLNYSLEAGPVSVDLAAGSSTGEGTDTLTSIEIIIGSGGNDTIVGDSGDNIFDGALGDDLINGAGGADTVNFLTFSGAIVSTGITANLATGTATGSGTDTLVAIENLTGAYGNDSFTGDGGPNLFIGGEGNDSLSGGAGDDNLIGGFHTDSLNGGPNTDTCDSEPGADGRTDCEITPVPAARFDGSVTSCGGTCAELLMTIVNVNGLPVGEAIIGNVSNGTMLTGGMPPPGGWQELGGKGDGGVCFTEGTTFHGATNSASAVQPGASLPYTSYQMEPDPTCPSHSNFWYWQVGSLDGGFIEDGAFSINDTDGDNYFDPVDNCPAVVNPTQSNIDGDALGDACDPDADGDGVSGSAEGQCGDAIDNDANGLINDGCPQIAASAESGSQCANAIDDDGDGWINDGCPGASETVACGASALNAASRPERIDTPGDDDGDTLVNEALPPGAAAYDCDGDGYAGTREANVTTSDQDPCGGSGWPSDLFPSTPGGFQYNTLNIQDLGSFIAPVRRMGTSLGNPNFSVRWDLVPGGTIGGAINLQDIAATVTGASGFPPMLGGQQKAFGKVCPYAP
jgi:Ca2+-binding RTX toxin-like protein